MVCPCCEKLRLEGLRKKDVELSLPESEIIEDYVMQGRPLPGCLVLSFMASTSIHVVIAIDEKFDRIFIVTVYKPSSERWKNDWKQGKMNNKRCPLCSGDMADGTTAIPFFIDEKIVVIKDVPAEICADCGEAYMKSSVVGEIETILDRLNDLNSEMSVIHYRAA